jgi:hypothetical protein
MQFDERQIEALDHYPSELILDDPIAMDDAFKALSRATEGVVSSSAQSPRRDERSQRGDKDTGPPEVLGDRIDRVSNHVFPHLQPTLVEANAGIQLQEAADLVDSTWSMVCSTDEAPSIERSMTKADAGAMFRHWLDAPPPNDPFFFWTMRTKI